MYIQVHLSAQTNIWTFTISLQDIEDDKEPLADADELDHKYEFEESGYIETDPEGLQAGIKIQNFFKKFKTESGQWCISYLVILNHKLHAYRVLQQISLH